MQYSLETLIEKGIEQSIKNSMPTVTTKIGNEALSPGFNNPTHEDEVYISYMSSTYSQPIVENKTLKARVAKFQVVIYSRRIQSNEFLYSRTESIRDNLISFRVNVGTIDKPHHVQLSITNESVLPASLPVKGYSVLILNLETQTLFQGAR